MATGSTEIQTGLRLPVFSYNDILDITTSDDPWRRKDVNDSCSHFIGLMGCVCLSLRYYRSVVVLLCFFLPAHPTPPLLSLPYLILDNFCPRFSREGSKILTRGTKKEDKAPTEEALT